MLCATHKASRREAGTHNKNLYGNMETGIKPEKPSLRQNVLALAKYTFALDYIPTKHPAGRQIYFIMVGLI
jgi:hypothetical protein